MRSILMPMSMFLLLLAAVDVAAAPPSPVPGAATTPTEVRPILLGAAVPDVGLQALDGTEVRLRDVVRGKPSVLVFYRGGWCPYCNLQLQGLRLIQTQLDALGFQMLAISPDLPEKMRETLDKTPLEYTLLSDARAEAIRAFGLAFRVDDETYIKYQGYGIDLEKASGQTHRLLPVPGVYLVDADGTLQFSYVHPDYKVRLPEGVILAAAEAIRNERQKFEARRKP